MFKYKRKVTEHYTLRVIVKSLPCNFSCKCNLLTSHIINALIKVKKNSLYSLQIPFEKSLSRQQFKSNSRILWGIAVWLVRCTSVLYNLFVLSWFNSDLQTLNYFSPALEIDWKHTWIDILARSIDKKSCSRCEAINEGHFVFQV